MPGRNKAPLLGWHPPADSTTRHVAGRGSVHERDVYRFLN